MAALTALIALEPPAVDEPMLMAIAAGTVEPIGPASFLQRLLLGAVMPLTLRQGEAFLELYRTACLD